MCPDKMENITWIKEQLRALRNQAAVVLAKVEQMESASTTPANKKRVTNKALHREIDLTTRLLSRGPQSKPTKTT